MKPDTYKLDKCPYCGTDIVYVDSSIVYGKGKNYGMIYTCSNYPKYDAYVGVHPNTDIPLGRLANAELRNYKQQAHFYFDALWKCKKSKLSDKKARANGYIWLSEQLGIELKHTHIGWFDIDDCKRVINLCLPYYQKLKKKNYL